MKLHWLKHRLCQKSYQLNKTFKKWHTHFGVMDLILKTDETIHFSMYHSLIHVVKVGRSFKGRTAWSCTEWTQIRGVKKASYKTHMIHKQHAAAMLMSNCAPAFISRICVMNSELFLVHAASVKRHCLVSIYTCTNKCRWTMDRDAGYENKSHPEIIIAPDSQSDWTSSWWITFYKKRLECVSADLCKYMRWDFLKWLKW